MRPSKREEYIKRFEELTKQEIKNYNDSLLNTHTSLEEFRRQLKESVDQYANQVAQLSSKINKLESENRTLKTTIKKLDKKLESQDNDFNEFYKKSLLEKNEREKFQEWTKNEVRNSYNVDQGYRTEKREYHHVVNTRLDDLFTEIGHVYRQSKADNIKLKEEILAIPSEAEKVKEELLVINAISAVDKEGILKELNRVKKKSTVQESLNDYFHTQLERLKNKFSP